MATPEEAEQALLRSAREVLQKLAVETTPDGDQELRRIVSQAALKVAQDGPRGVDDPLATAQAQLERILVDAAFRQYPGADRVREGKAMGQRQLDPISSRVLNGALLSLCPGFWPFC